MIAFTIPGQPQGKGRPRIVKIAGEPVVQSKECFKVLLSAGQAGCKYRRSRWRPWHATQLRRSAGGPSAT